MLLLAAPVEADLWRQLDRDLEESLRPVLGEEEWRARASLKTAAQREQFLRLLWQLRDPTPDTPRNELQRRWQENVRVARARFPRLEGDQPETLVLAGAPDCSARLSTREFRPVEIWYYRASRLSPWRPSPPGEEGLVVLFVSGERWTPDDGLGVLFRQSARALRGLDLEGAVQRWRNGAKKAALAGCPEVGTESTDLFAVALRQAADEATLRRRTGFVRNPRSESLPTLLEASRDARPEQVYPAALDVRLAGQYEGRTVLTGEVRVPLSALHLESPDLLIFETFSVEGELRGPTNDVFQYDFHAGVAVENGRARLLFHRLLRPGDYTLRLAVRAAGGGDLLRREQTLQVPTGQPEASQVDAPSAAALKRLTAAEVAVFQSFSSVKLQGPSPDLLAVGRISVETATTGDVERVEYHLDGTAVGGSEEPPFRLDVDLGEVPREHTLEALAFDAGGRRVARDSVRLNAGPHRFSVRLLKPSPGSGAATRDREEALRVHAVVEVPLHRRLRRLELYLDDTLAATLHQPPFLHLLHPAASRRPTFVRAVAILEDETTTEDVALLVKAAGGVETVDVQMVELYATVSTRSGTLVTDLEAADFRVLEEGQEQEIRRFEKLAQVPINVALLIDTSSSMAGLLPQLRQGALGFFDAVLTERDLASVIQFSHRAIPLVPFTRDRERLRSSIEALGPAGGTRLFDSLVLSLHYLGGLSGKRALVWLSDGFDQHSRFTFEQLREFALRSGVAVYGIYFPQPGVDAGSRDARQRKHQKELLRQLSQQTGGRLFQVSLTRSLHKIYDIIQRELRSQYLVTYESSQAERGSGFQPVELRVPQGLQVRTRRGYYP